MNSKILIPVALLFVLAVSGCVIPGFESYQGIFQPQQPETTEASIDMLKVQNLNLIPSPPIPAESSFSLTFEVKNMDETQEVKANVGPYDIGLCEQTNGPAPSGGGVGGLVASFKENISVVHFTVDCGDGKTDTLHLADVNDARGTNIVNQVYLCGALCDCSVTINSADTLNLKIGSQEQTYWYYNCEHGTPAECTKTYGSKTVKYDSITQEDKSSCVSTADSDPVVCGRYLTGETTNDITCQEKCNLRGGRKVVDSTATSCWPEYEQAGGFNGYCCRCGSEEWIGPAPEFAGEFTFAPQQTETMEWWFTAPTNAQIVNMPYTCPIRYKIEYGMTAKTQTEVTVVDEAKLRELQRSGQYQQVTPKQNVYMGPVKIFFEFGLPQPVKEGDVLPLFITVEDKGSGRITGGGNIATGNLKIKLPSGFTVKSCDKFSGTTELTNTQQIPVIKKKSPQLRCAVQVPSVTDLRTYYIQAELTYVYELDYQQDVQINPTITK